MKKRTLLIIAMMTAVSLLAFLAFAGTRSENGYELFKDVLRNHETYAVESGAASGHITVSDNGQTLFDLSGHFKGSEVDRAFSGSLKLIAPSIEKHLAIYGLEDQFYLVDPENKDAYIGKQTEERSYEDYHDYDVDFDEEQFNEKAEAILDILVGDLKNEFKTLTDTDGTTDVQFELTKEEMPALINLLTSAGGDEAYHEESTQDLTAYMQYPLFQEIAALEFDQPELENVEVDLLSVTLDLNQAKQIDGIAFVIAFTGEDAKDAVHKILIEGAFNIEQLGNVTVDMPELDGMTIYELPEEDM